jgi:thiol-disulfide isomerase/thioredoxin
MKLTHTIIAGMLLTAAAAFAKGSMSSDQDSERAGTMTGEPEAPAEGGIMMADTVPGGAMMSSGSKVLFTSLDDARMLAAAGPTVMYFHAGWCPQCRLEMQEIDSRLSELGNITVVVVDYDRYAELKKRYGVTYQHTYVQIDAQGKKIAVWNGGGVDGILENVVRGGM